MGKHADATGDLSQHLGKEEKRSTAMGEAVRFLTYMDRSYLGQVRPRFGKRSQFSFPLMEQLNPRFRDPYSLVALILARCGTGNHHITSHHFLLGLRPCVYGLAVKWGNSNLYFDRWPLPKCTLALAPP